MKLSFRLAIGAMLLALAWSTSVHAKKNYLTPGTEKFKLFAGVGLTRFDSDIRLGSSNLPLSANISLEDDLDMDQQIPAAQIGGYWRFKPKHRLYVDHTRLQRSGDVTAQRDISLGDDQDGNPITVRAGAQIATDLNVNLTAIDYRYSFFNRKDFELYASGGIFWAELKFRVFAQGELNDGTGFATGREFETSTSGQGPLPAIGIGGQYFIKPNWSLGAAGKGFFIEIGDIRGALSSLNFFTEYYFTKHVGIGGALSNFKLDVEFKDNTSKAKIDYTYFGPAIYLVGKF